MMLCQTNSLSLCSTINCQFIGCRMRFVSPILIKIVFCNIFFLHNNSFHECSKCVKKYFLIGRVSCNEANIAPNVNLKLCLFLSIRCSLLSPLFNFLLLLFLSFISKANKEYIMQLYKGYIKHKSLRISFKSYTIFFFSFLRLFP